MKKNVYNARYLASILIFILIINIILPTKIIKAETNINIIKNNSFEENLNNWIIWTANSELKIGIDTNKKIDGNNSVKLLNDSINPISGSISQNINVDIYRGKTIKLSQWISSENFSGEIKVKAKFYNENNVLLEEDIKDVYLQGNNEWKLKEYSISIPSSMDMKYVKIEYVYNNSKGRIWLDNAKGEIIESLQTSNISKNVGFEEDFSYWKTWNNNIEMKIEIDSIMKIGGNNSAKLKNSSNSTFTGTLSQDINIKNYLGKTIKLSQWIKSEAFTGEMQIKAKFYNKSNVLLKEDLKSVYIQGNTDWKSKEYLIDINNDINIEYIKLEYVYNNSKGSIWIDDIKTEVIDSITTNNIAKNRGFEEDLSYWKIWKRNNNLNIEIDDTEVKTGIQSIKLYNNTSEITGGTVAQEINVNNSLGKTIRIQQWVKSKEFNGSLEIRATFLNLKGETVGAVDTKSILINGTEDWKLGESLINIPNTIDINVVRIEYIYNNGTGTVLLDDISMDIVDTIQTDNIIKNSGFEENLSYWRSWQIKPGFIVDIDKIDKKEGINSLKIYNGTSEITSGIVSQKINVPDVFQGKILSIDQWIKTNNVLGEAIQARVKFLDENGMEIYQQQTTTLGISQTEDWNNKKFNIFLPSNKKVVAIDIEYIFDSFKGNIWIDEITAKEELEKVNRNIIQNGSFESIIKNPVSHWYLGQADNEIGYKLDSTDIISGKYSLEITPKNQSNNPKISQKIQISDELRGCNIKISEYIKTDTKNILYSTIKYLDSNGSEVVKSDVSSFELVTGAKWNKYEQKIKISNNQDIESIQLEYSMKNAEGNVWLDDIRVEPYIAIENISLDPYIIKLQSGEVKTLQFNIEPANASYKDLIISSSNSNIVNVENNKLKALSKGITKIIVEQPYEGKKVEFPVIVDEDNNISIENTTNIEAIQGDTISGKVNIKSTQTNYKYSVLIEGKSGYIDLKDDGSFNYYLDSEFIGKDTFIIKVEDNSGNSTIAQYNLNVRKKQLDLSDNNFIITAIENTETTGKIDIKLDQTLKFSLAKAASKGAFVINSDGTYSYKGTEYYYGYDSAEINVVTENNETSIIKVIIYIAPNTNTMLNKLNGNSPKLMVNNDQFIKIKSLIKTDDIAKEWFGLLKRDVDKILTLPIVPYEKADGMRLTVTSKEYIEKLSFMYKITDEIKYADRAWKELDNISKYPDWNENHFLDTAALSVASATGYDWLYDYLSNDQRNIIKNSIIEKALNKAKVHYDNRDGFTAMTNNWNIICNSSMIFSSLAIADNTNSEITLETVENALKSIQKTLYSYYKDGSSFEGPEYWEYTTEYLMQSISSIENVLGISNAFDSIINLEEMANFSLQINKGASSFNYADAEEKSMQNYLGLWFAKELNDSKYSEFTKTHYNSSKLVSIYNLLWYDPNLYNKDTVNLLDKYFSKNELVTMKSSFTNDYGTFVGFKGGTTGVEHGDLDIGSFVFDALGVRWALDLGSENYNLPGYFDSEAYGQRWKYYRKRAEGHNTLVIGNSINEDQVIGTTSKIVENKLNTNDPYAILDMTSAYSNIAANIKRKVQLINDRKDLVLEDEFLLKEIEEVAWQMHTDAAITVLEDGKTLILEKDGQQVKMIITSDTDISIDVIDANPGLNLISPPNQNENIGVKKIIAKTKVKNGKIKVQMIPQGNHNLIKSRINNSGFENGLNEWNTWNPIGNLKVEGDSTQKQDKEYSAKISSLDGENSRGTLYQTIDISKYFSNKFKISQWMKSENLSGNIIGRYSYLDSNGQQIGEKESMILLTAGTKDWELIETNLNIPNNTKKITIEYLYDNSTGSVWIDNINQVYEKSDVNDDGITDILDLSLVAQKYNQICMKDNWYSEYDLKEDQLIDIYDLISIANKIN